MATFKVEDPFEIEPTRKRAGRILTKESIREFWDKYFEVMRQRSCLVFAFKAAKVFKLVYVGKVTKTFRQQVFTDHEVRKYNAALADQLRGKPVMFFVVPENARGPANTQAIDEAESFLIQSGILANKNLADDQKVKVPSWNIQGVIRGKRGTNSRASVALKKSLNLR